MPTYEYVCEKCEVEFEELLLNKDDISKYFNEHPCPSCGEPARRVVSQFSFNFKGDVRGLSGVHGNSGVHDLDYPTLDKAVARSSEKRWAVHRERQESINKIRQETGTHAVSMGSIDGSGGIGPADKGSLSLREKALPTLKKLKKSIDSQK